MIDMTANRFSWRLPLYGLFGAIIVVLPQIFFGNDIGTFLVTAVFLGIVSLILLVILFRKIRRHALAALAMVAIFCTVSWLLFRVSDDVRTTGRWLIHSKSYKAEVFAQSTSADGALKHVEWDGWGFAGVGDTVVYLVFDPNDSLATAARKRSPGKFSGIPCRVVNIQRLESHWYTVLFYTDTTWDHCSQ
jgi:hypothetical protein